MLTCMMVGASGYVSPRTPSARLSSGWWRPSPPRHSNEVEVWFPEVVTAVSVCRQKLIKFRIRRNVVVKKNILTYRWLVPWGEAFAPPPPAFHYKVWSANHTRNMREQGSAVGQLPTANSAAGCRAGVWWKVSSSEIRLHHLLRWSLVAEYL